MSVSVQMMEMPDAVKAPAGNKWAMYGGPTWEAMDGSKVAGKQQAVAPSSAGNIPLQLVKAEPAMGKGMMEGVTRLPCSPPSRRCPTRRCRRG